MSYEYDNIKGLIEVKMIEEIDSLKGIEDYLCNHGHMSRHKAIAFVKNTVKMTQQNDLKLIADLFNLRKS
jgi:hypothetical protein